MRYNVAKRGKSRSALLVDLDNFVIEDAAEVGGRSFFIDVVQAELHLRRAAGLACPSDFRLVVAPRPTVVKYGPTLAALGLRWRIVPIEPDAADAELLTEAFRLMQIGYDRFFVVSGDHYFAELAGVADTTVIVRKGQPISRVLRRAAARVYIA